MQETYKHHIRHYTGYHDEGFWVWEITCNTRKVAGGTVLSHEGFARHCRDAVLRSIIDDATRADRSVGITDGEVIIGEEQVNSIEADQHLLDGIPSEWTDIIRKLRRQLAAEAWDHRQRAKNIGCCPTGDKYLHQYRHARHILRLLRLLQRQGPTSPLIGAANNLIETERRFR